MPDDKWWFHKQHVMIHTWRANCLVLRWFMWDFVWSAPVSGRVQHVLHLCCPPHYFHFSFFQRAGKCSFTFSFLFLLQDESCNNVCILSSRTPVPLICTLWKNRSANAIVSFCMIPIQWFNTLSNLHIFSTWLFCAFSYMYVNFHCLTCCVSCKDL